MNKIVQRFLNEIRSARLKDLERLAFALSLYNYEHKMEPSIYKLIGEELCRSERTQEIQKVPKCLPCCLHDLSLQKVDLTEEISKVLDKSFICDVYGMASIIIAATILPVETGWPLHMHLFRISQPCNIRTLLQFSTFHVH
jgi:hypothetical protein